MSTVYHVRPPRSDSQEEINRFYLRVCELLSYLTYAGDPTNNVTPRFIGDRCNDTSNDEWYVSHGITSADWQKITP